MITPIILSGGGGTRLWPLSTPENPKQFLRLFDDKSLFQNTVLRCQNRDKFSAPIIVGGARHIEITQKQLQDIAVNDAQIICEPAARNTAPAIALAALSCAADTIMLVMPSDHLIGKEDLFLKAVEQAKAPAMQGYLITFGINPTKAETGYGYIKCGDEIDAFNGVHAVPAFKEKPDLASAKAMIENGHYLWNAGIFLFRADAYLSALDLYAPDILAAAQNSLQKQDSGIIHPDKIAFEASPSDSIDYAVMEKADKVAVMPVSPKWSDVGSWDSIAEILDKGDDNIIIGKAKTIDARGNLIWSHDSEVQLIGVNDMIVIAHEGKIVMLPRGQSQDVKKLNA